MFLFWHNRSWNSRSICIVRITSMAMWGSKCPGWSGPVGQAVGIGSGISQANESRLYKRCGRYGTEKVASARGVGTATSPAKQWHVSSLSVNVFSINVSQSMLSLHCIHFYLILHRWSFGILLYEMVTLGECACNSQRQKSLLLKEKATAAWL